jgi:DNA-directed RNA polymerase specialized sigma24 family protein
VKSQARRGADAVAIFTAMLIPMMSAYADEMRTSTGTDDDGGVIPELASVAAAKQALSRREEVAVRRARNLGLSWAEIGTLLGVTRQTIHRKYRKVG